MVKKIGELGWRSNSAGLESCAHTAGRGATGIWAARTVGLVIALSIAAPAGVIRSAFAVGGPCTTDNSVPGTTTVTCATPLATTTDNAPAIGYGLSAGAGGTTFGGGIGGTGAQADASVLNASAAFSTSGSNSPAISATVSGGAGGDAHGGGVAGAGGRGGDLTVVLTGEITTTGKAAVDVAATSSGGRGGSSFGGGIAGRGGQGGNLTLTLSGTITTHGDGSHAVKAVTIGGDGGSDAGGVAGDGGKAGRTSVTSSGAVTATGVDAHGILATSSRGNNGNLSGDGGAGSSVTVDITGGSVKGGSGTGWGVRLEAETTAALTNAGVISALSGNAVYASGTEVTVDNSGTITGNVTLADSHSSVFRNLAGGIFESGATVDLGASGNLENAGTLSPGGTGKVEATALTGNYVQTSTGIYKVDADWTSGKSDRLDVSGTASLAGTVIVNPIAFPSTGGLTRTFTILTAAGGITDNGIKVQSTAAVDYTLQKPDTKTLDVKAVINFLGATTTTEPTTGSTGQTGIGTGGLNANQRALGTNLNGLYSGGTNLGFMSDLLTLATQDELKAALNKLLPSGDSSAHQGSMTTGNTFAGQLLSCRVFGEGDANAIIREGQCVWARGSARTLDKSGERDGLAANERATFVSGGAQLDLGGPWRLGVGLGYETTDLDVDARAKISGERLHVGGIVKYNEGPWLFAAGLTGGHGWYDSTRAVAFGGFATTATSEFDQSFIVGRMTGAYLLDLGRVYLKPEVSAAVTYLKRDASRERATGGAALAVDASDDTILSVSPILEIGTQIALAKDAVARPFIRGGLTWRDTDTFSTRARFADAGPGATPFTVTTRIDDIVAEFGAGLDLVTAGDAVLRLGYEGQFGDTTTQHTGSAKLSVRF